MNNESCLLVYNCAGVSFWFCISLSICMLLSFSFSYPMAKGREGGRRDPLHLYPFSFLLFQNMKGSPSPFSFGCLFLFLDPRLSSAISSLFCSSPLYFLDKTQIEYSLHFRYYGIEKAMVWKVMSSTRYRSISRKLYVLSHSGTSSSLWSLVYPGTFFFCDAI